VCKDNIRLCTTTVIAGFDTEAEGGKKTTHGSAEGSEGKREKRLDNIQWEIHSKEEK